MSQPTPSRTTKPDKSRRLHIIIADDDEDDRTLIADALSLTRMDIATSEAVDGQDLLEKLRDSADTPSCPLVLLDLNMPRMGGFELLGQLRADPVFRRSPVVVLSTSSSDEDVARAYEIGANAYLVKPSTFDELVTMAKELVRHWTSVAILPPVGKKT